MCQLVIALDADLKSCIRDLCNLFVLRASPAVLNMCAHAKIFFASKFSYVLFCNPTNKTETGTAHRNRWGITNNKPPGAMIVMGQSETLLHHI
jgi:hypothetical protein